MPPAGTFRALRHIPAVWLMDGLVSEQQASRGDKAGCDMRKTTWKPDSDILIDAIQNPDRNAISLLEMGGRNLICRWKGIGGL